MSAEQNIGIDELKKINEFIKYLILLNMNNPNINLLNFLTDAGRANLNMGLEVRTKFTLPGSGFIKLKESPSYKVNDLVNSFNKVFFYRGKDKKRQNEQYKSKFWNYEKVKEKMEELKINNDIIEKIKMLDFIPYPNMAPQRLINGLNDIPLSEILTKELYAIPLEPQLIPSRIEPVIKRSAVYEDFNNRLENLKKEPEPEPHRTPKPEPEPQRTPQLEPEPQRTIQIEQPQPEPQRTPQLEPQLEYKTPQLIQTDTINNAVTYLKNDILPQLPKMALKYGTQFLTTKKNRLEFSKDINKYLIASLQGLGFTGGFIYNTIINSIYEYVIDWSKKFRDLTPEEEKQFIEELENLPPVPSSQEMKPEMKHSRLTEDLNTEEFTNEIDNILKKYDIPDYKVLSEGEGDESGDGKKPRFPEAAIQKLRQIINNTDSNIIKAIISSGVLFAGYKLSDIIKSITDPQEEKQIIETPIKVVNGIYHKPLVINVTPDVGIIKPNPENEERYNKFIFKKAINDVDNPLQLMNDLNNELRFFNNYLNRNLMKNEIFGVRYKNNDDIIKAIKGSPLMFVGDDDWTAFRHGQLGGNFSINPNNNLINEFFDDQLPVPYMYDNFQQNRYN